MAGVAKGTDVFGLTEFRAEAVGYSVSCVVSLEWQIDKPVAMQPAFFVRQGALIAQCLVAAELELRAEGWVWGARDWECSAGPAREHWARCNKE